MADRQVKAILAVDYQGEREVLKAQQDLREVNTAATDAQGGLDKTSGGFDRVALGAVALGAGLFAAQKAFQTVGRVAEAAYEQINRGADLELQKQQFDALAVSIGTTGDALQNDLGNAMNGLVSNADQIVGATQLISLGLAKTHEEALALSEVSGKLNWDMQVLGLTLANQSMARLDSLGLSIDGVKSKIAELVEGGMDANEAFKWAIIEEGRDKIELLGDAADSGAGKIQKLEVAGQNMKDSFSGLAFTLFEAAGGIEAVEAAATNLNILADALGKIDKYKDTGQDIKGLIDALVSGDWDKVASEVEDLDRATQIATDNREYENLSWAEYAFAVRNGLVLTREMTAETAAADAAMLGQAERWRDAQTSIEAYGATAYTAALAQQALANVDLSALDAQIAFSKEMAAAVEAYASAVAEATSRGGDYFTQFSQAEDGFNYAEALYATADAAGAGITPLSDLAVQYGLMDQATADAATAAAQSQSIMESLAGDAANGIISWENYADAVKQAVDALNGVTEPRAAVPLPDRHGGGDAWDENFAEPVRTYEPIPLEVELQTQAIEDAVVVARGIVEGFTNPAEAYEAVMELEISDVETKAVRATELINGIPTHKEITISVTAQGMAILDELRAVGAIP